MKQINTYISEKLHLNKDFEPKYKYHPSGRLALRRIVIQLIKERGKDADLNDIDTSKVERMFSIFSDLDPHNINISEWNVSNVKDMRAMFYGCKNFNCDISKWDVSKVQDMSVMFLGCEKFDCDLENWKVNAPRNMQYGAFDKCESLKIPSWYKG
ncbi:MAG: BspA family leucine-rich repeat surface protein [Clostridia bacterium]|nr:BspA family leucine-rich repeat surface protein [Clostridia bacterium]